MIRRNANGKHYCDGRRCGYPLAWFQGDPVEDGADGEWVCLDCGDRMYADAPGAEQPAPPEKPALA
ncbi:hypothetical protein [Mesorhizobium sp.]|uniref:hypothetical protein n=1 Tax=Mesorhizobium sp. TaxID=1871066 RepID=UPI000FE63644|nr:hypothetical protein [Mesorhizobium sp.]RWB67606.1 MAG: hypothetical protein EOQ49_25130 [Mesorhizobium sp.]